jgi:glycosyltransferase involved in cell wall biosynthesis
LVNERPGLLFVAPWFLFPRISGGRIRTTDVLRGMKGGAFEITVVSPRPTDGKDWSGEIASICDHFVCWVDDTHRSVFHSFFNLVSRLPVSVALDRSRSAREAIASELASLPDVVVLDFVHTAILTPAGPLPMRSILFTHNVESEIYGRNADVARNALARAVWRSQRAKMERFERDALRRFDTVVAVSERDGEFFRDEIGIANVRVIPTGVDVDFYSFAPKSGGGDLTGKGGKLVFTGSMDWRPNIDGLQWLMDEVWARIVATSPDSELLIVGRNPPRRLVAEVARRGLAWTFTGLVDDVRPYVHDADVYVVPLLTGGGTRLKVYETMALGCPVVSTTVAVEGLPLVPDEHYVRAEDAEDFAAAVLRLLRDPELRERIAAAARKYVAANFSPRIVGRAFEEICLAGGGRARSYHVLRGE